MLNRNKPDIVADWIRSRLDNLTDPKLKESFYKLLGHTTKYFEVGDVVKFVGFVHERALTRGRHYKIIGNEDTAGPLKAEYHSSIIKDDEGDNIVVYDRELILIERAVK